MQCACKQCVLFKVVLLKERPLYNACLHFSILKAFSGPRNTNYGRSTTKDIRQRPDIPLTWDRLIVLCVAAVKIFVNTSMAMRLNKRNRHIVRSTDAELLALAHGGSKSVGKRAVRINFSIYIYIKRRFHGAHGNGSFK